MNKQMARRRSETIGGIILFLLLLTVVGFLLQGKVRMMFNRYAEEQVALQAESLAHRIDDLLGAELMDLENIRQIHGENASWQNLQTQPSKGVRMGVLQHQGTAVCGESLPVCAWPGIASSFQGHPAVSYRKGQGMLFTVPVYHGKNVKYVLYRLYNEDQVQQHLGFRSFDSQGRVTLELADHTELTIRAEDWEKEDWNYLQSLQSGKMLETLKIKLYSATAAALRDHGSDRDGKFVFLAEIKNLDGRLVGFVPISVMAGGLMDVVWLIIWVFGLLVVLFAISSMYLFGMEKKSWESDELRRAKQQADRANQAKSDFLASMSHEIRTPLNAVMGMNEMILRECQDPGIQEYAQNIDGASHTLLSLINDILDFSKVEAGRMDIVFMKYDLSEVLHDVVNMVQLKAEKKNLAFQVEIDGKIPAQLYGDPTRVRQVIINILNNAVKYTPQGNVTLQVALSTQEELPLTVEVPKDIMLQRVVTLQIGVSDTGIGIKPEDREKLFKDFVRLDVRKNQNIEGTGLGLALTQRLLALMGGKISVESVYGEGSVFTVYLPQGVMDAVPIGDFAKQRHRWQKEALAVEEHFIAPQGRVLVVDDNQMNRFVVKSLLKHSKVQVALADSGQACVEILQKERFDLILLDHMMPEMDGIETLQIIRARHLADGTPFIALTANAIVGSREKYLATGFTDYLSKPIVGNSLDDILKKYLPAEKLQWLSATAEKKSSLVTEQVESPGEGTTSAADIDEKLGLEFSSNDKELYQEMLQIFCEDAAEEQRKIETALAAGDWKHYTTGVHALKSTALTIGARGLSEQAKALEAAGKKKDSSFIRAKHAEVMALYQQVVKKIQEQRMQKEAGGGNEK